MVVICDLLRGFFVVVFFTFGSAHSLRPSTSGSAGIWNVGILEWSVALRCGVLLEITAVRDGERPLFRYVASSSRCGCVLHGVLVFWWSA